MVLNVKKHFIYIPVKTLRKEKKIRINVNKDVCIEFKDLHYIVDNQHCPNFRRYAKAIFFISLLIKNKATILAAEATAIIVIDIKSSGSGGGCLCVTCHSTRIK